MKEMISMSDAVIITLIICITIAVLGIVGSFGDKK